MCIGSRDHLSIFTTYFPNGDYTRRVELAYKTQNYYIIKYLHFKGRSIEPYFLVLDLSMKVIIQGRTRHCEDNSIACFLGHLRKGNYDEAEEF